MVSLGQHNGCWDSTELPRAVRFSELLKQFSWRLLHSSTLLVSCFSVSSSFFSTVGNFRVLIYLLDYNFLILGSYQTRSVPNWNWRKEKKITRSVSWLPQPISGRQDRHSGGHITGMPPLLLPHSILQSSGKTQALSVLPPVASWICNYISLSKGSNRRTKCVSCSPDPTWNSKFVLT